MPYECEKVESLAEAVKFADSEMMRSIKGMRDRYSRTIPQLMRLSPEQMTASQICLLRRQLSTLIEYSAIIEGLLISAVQGREQAMHALEEQLRGNQVLLDLIRDKQQK